jgi:hypothetical protein
MSQDTNSEPESFPARTSAGNPLAVALSRTQSAGNESLKL